MTDKSIAASLERRYRERSELALAEIKARQAEVVAAIDRGEPAIDVGQFNMVQLGLSVAVVDKKGRLWRFEGRKLILCDEPAARLWDQQYPDRGGKND